MIGKSPDRVENTVEVFEMLCSLNVLQTVYLLGPIAE